MVEMTPVRQGRGTASIPGRGRADPKPQAEKKCCHILGTRIGHRDRECQR